MNGLGLASLRDAYPEWDITTVMLNGITYYRGTRDGVKPVLARFPDDLRKFLDRRSEGGSLDSS